VATVRLWKQRKAEFLLPITAFAGVALLGVLPGIALMALDRSPGHAPPRLVRDLIVAALSLVFSILFICYSRNTGYSFWVTGYRSS
jgi:hypothetical protein